MQYVGKLDRNIFRCVTDDITTDDVIITDERIQHIQERHPNDWERFMEYIPQIVADPDYILEANQPNTAFVLKRIKDAGEQFELILRVKVSSDPTEYKNTIITFLRIKDKKWRKYLRNNSTDEQKNKRRKASPNRWKCAIIEMRKH